MIVELIEAHCVIVSIGLAASVLLVMHRIVLVVLVALALVHAYTLLLWLLVAEVVV